MPQQGTLCVQTEFGFLIVPVGHVCVIPRGLRFTVTLPDGGQARAFACEVFNAHWKLPDRGIVGQAGLASARHFEAPTAAYEDRACASGYTIVGKHSGSIFQATQSYSPYDVVGWTGNYHPYRYNLFDFQPIGMVCSDHIDPSAHTVLHCPFDAATNTSLVDFVCFRGRWDASSGSFRPPYYHRNAATEFNAVLTMDSEYSGYKEGCYFLSPQYTPHGVNRAGAVNHIKAASSTAEVPVRLSDRSLWIMFESTLHIRLTPWARNAVNREKDFRGNMYTDAPFENFFTGPASSY